jgi:hypothetical protein
MFFVYCLALIGLGVLVFLAWAALADAISEVNDDSDPYDEALDAAARLNAGAWEAIQELRQLGSSAPPDVPDDSGQKS